MSTKLEKAGRMSLRHVYFVNNETVGRNMIVFNRMRVVGGIFLALLTQAIFEALAGADYGPEDWDPVYRYIPGELAFLMWHVAQVVEAHWAYELKERASRPMVSYAALFANLLVGAGFAMFVAFEQKNFDDATYDTEDALKKTYLFFLAGGAIIFAVAFLFSDQILDNRHHRVADEGEHSLVRQQVTANV